MAKVRFCLISCTVCLLTFRFPIRYIDAESGRRSDTAHQYLYNQGHNKNLKILDGCCVVRIVFEYVVINLSPVAAANLSTETTELLEWNMLKMPWDEPKVPTKRLCLPMLHVLSLFPLELLALLPFWRGDHPSTLRSARLITTAQRSGIGASDVLRRNGIPQLIDLPGVGEHYMGKQYLRAGSSALKICACRP